MVRWCAIQIAIFGSGCSLLLRGQDTVGIYFSSRGFSFDPFYKKAILSEGDTTLAGKGFFLLQLTDTMSYLLQQAGFPAYNLHRHPEYASVVEEGKLPPGWRGFVIFRSLSLKAIEEKAVFAQSNRFRVEKYVILLYDAIGEVGISAGKQLFRWQGELPSPGWRQALVRELSARIKEALR